MIITRTPLRISFTGGGTDLADYYKINGGAVVSMAINKYIYITVNKKFDNAIRVSYSSTEIVQEVSELHHELVRESMRLADINGGIEITSIADIPSGTGLGSSSSFTVGVLNALFTYAGHRLSGKELAELACRVEIDILGHPYGCHVVGNVQPEAFGLCEHNHIRSLLSRQREVSPYGDDAGFVVFSVFLFHDACFLPVVRSFAVALNAEIRPARPLFLGQQRSPFD